MIERSQNAEARCQKSEVLPDKGVREAIGKVLAGDVDAYEEIYAACDRGLRAFVARRYGHLGGDFTDEVVIRTHEYAFSHLDCYDSDKGASFQTWLNWQSRNVAKRVRLERREPNTISLVEELDVQYVLTPSDPAEEHERQRRNRVLRQELKALAEQGRLSIAGHGSGRWTFSTTARRLDLTVPQARYRYERACREMKERLVRRGVRPTEVVPCFGRVGTLPDDSGDEDDRAARPMAILPDGPDTLAGRPRSQKKRRGRGKTSKSKAKGQRARVKTPARAGFCFLLDLRWELALGHWSFPLRPAAKVMRLSLS
jgi:RNA polymerase sigma factor (sigma-70 family)